MKGKPKIKRNKKLVQLRNKKGLSFRELARFFNIDVKTAWEIYQRDKDKYVGR